MVDDQGYNQLFTMHGTIMMLLFGTPMAAALANYLVPLQIGAADMAFPRLNALSFWLFLFGGLIVLSGYSAAGGPADVGWTGYPPELRRSVLDASGTDLWIVGLALTGIASILGAVNFIATIFTRRAPGMSMFRMPIFTWTILVTSILILFAFPALTAALAMLLLDRRFGAAVLRPGRRAATRSSGSTSSGSSATPRSTSSSCRSSGSCRRSSRSSRASRCSATAPSSSRRSSSAPTRCHVWAHHMFTTGAVSLPFFSAHVVHHRRADRHQVLQLDRDDVARPPDVPDADAVVRSGSSTSS